MKAEPLSPVQLFDGAKRYLIPLFQRPYVWTEKNQWAPLWDDVRAVAERVAMAGPYGSVSPHFLGAVVTEPVNQMGALVQQWTVIDGQQRLTTLQLMLDAAELVAQELGDEQDANVLRHLIVNADVGPSNDAHFKVWPTNRDRAAFAAVMDGIGSVPASESGSRIVQAHRWFVAAIRGWVVQGAATKEMMASRVHSLRVALTQGLSVVGISLEHGDNAQVIFETLNFRGAPLLAADLVKNLMFQIAQQQNCDVETLYAKYWSEFDDDYWREPVRQGRLMRPRVDVFLQHWLTMTLGEEVASDHIFTRFRDDVASPDQPVEKLFQKLHHDVLAYRDFLGAPIGSTRELFRYHVLEVLDSSVVMPVALWFLVRESADADSQADAALQVLDSWLIRRAILRLTNKDLNHFAADMIHRLKDLPDGASPSEALTAHLLDQSSVTRLWPDDDYLGRELRSMRLYRSVRRDLNRALLEACEDSIREERHVEETHCARNLSVEHVMPQSWQATWPLPDADDETVARREALVQSLGNLTLVTGSHNSALSNRPWRVENGKDKRDYLNSNSALLLNADLVQHHPDEWSDADIAARGTSLAARILRAWPRPTGGASTAAVLASTRAATPTRSASRPLAYEVHGPGWSRTNIPQRQAHLLMVQQLHAAGVSMRTIADVIDSARLREVSGTMSGQELWEAFAVTFNLADDTQRRWFVDEAIHDGGSTWIVRKSWGRQGDDLLTRLAGLKEGFGWSSSTLTPETKGSWQIDDVLDALGDDEELSTAFLTLARTVEDLGGRVYGSSAALPSAGFSLPVDEGTIWLYSFYTDNLAQPLRVTLGSAAAGEGTDEAFAERIAAIVPEFPLEELRASGFHRMPAISAERLVQPGVAEALGKAAEVYVTGTSGPRWWGIHNDVLPFPELLSGGFVSVGWTEVPDLATLGSNLEAIKRLLRAANPAAPDGAINNWAGILTKFSHAMRQGDFVIAPDKATRTINIGKVSGHYWYDAGAEMHPHRLPVKWLRTGIPREQFSEAALNEIGSALTLFRVKTHTEEFNRAVNQKS